MNTLQRVQGLVAGAGERLGLTEDPLSTILGSRVSKKYQIATLNETVFVFLSAIPARLSCKKHMTRSPRRPERISPRRTGH